MSNTTDFDVAAIITGFLQLFAPQPCYDEFFVNFNFFHGPCLKIALSKGLGYAIIFGSLLVKVPQVVKIWRARSAEGISIYSVTLEMVAILASLAYGFGNKFPFSAYGETLFLLIQTWIIAYLVLYYKGKTTIALAYSAVTAAILAFLMSPAVPMQLLVFLQSTVMLNVAAARLIQAAENYRNGSTGQLSFLTVLLLFLGAIARIFTSIQETNDGIMVLTYMSSAFFNGIIFLQLLYYWNSPTKVKTKSKSKGKAKRK